MADVGRGSAPCITGRVVRDLLLAGICLLCFLPGTPLRGQEMGPGHWEVRLGVVYTSPFWEAEIALPRDDDRASEVETIEMRPGIGPELAVGYVRPLIERLDGEVRGAVAFQGIEAEGPIFTWDRGSSVIFSARAGLRWAAWRSLELRGTGGFLYYSGGDLTVWDEGGRGALLAGAGIAYRFSVPFPVEIEAEAQRHGFGTVRLREAGAPDGSVSRFLFSVATPIGGRR